VVAEHVEAKRVEPGEKSLPRPEASQGLKGPEKNLLGQIVGVPVIARHPKGQAKNRPLVRIDQIGEGLAVPRKDSCDDLPFVDLLHIQIGPAKSHTLLCIFRDRNGRSPSLLNDIRRGEKLFYIGAFP